MILKYLCWRRALGRARSQEDWWAWGQSVRLGQTPWGLVDDQSGQYWQWVVREAGPDPMRAGGRPKRTILTVSGPSELYSWLEERLLTNILDTEIQWSVGVWTFGPYYRGLISVSESVPFYSAVIDLRVLPSVVWQCAILLSVLPRGSDLVYLVTAIK